MTVPRSPSGLGAAGRRLWAAVHAGYELSEAELHVLELGCVAADRSAQARAEIDRHGITVDGRYGPRLNPAVPVERDARAAVLAHLRALGVVNPPELPPVNRSKPGPKPTRRTR